MQIDNTLKGDEYRKKNYHKSDSTCPEGGDTFTLNI
jgi:hypothetical protein